MLEAMKPLLEIAKSHLWRWKTFSFTLPKPITMQNEGTKNKALGVKDLFIEPQLDELKAVATTSKGRPKKLNHEQMKSIHRTGEFSVDSITFPGQKHRWRLSNLLQKGSERSTETMYRTISHAAHLIGEDF